MYLSLIKDKERSHKMWSYGNFWPPVFDCTVQLRIVKIVQKYDKIGPKLQYPIPIKSPFSVWQRPYLPLMFIFQFYRNSKSLFDFYHLKRAGRGILMNPSSPLRWKPTPNLDSKFCGYWSFWNFSPLWRPRPCLEFHSDVSFLWTSSLHVEHLKKLEERILLLLKKNVVTWNAILSGDHSRKFTFFSGRWMFHKRDSQGASSKSDQNLQSSHLLCFFQPLKVKS